MRFAVVLAGVAVVTALACVSAGSASSAYRTPATRGMPTSVYFSTPNISVSDEALYFQRVHDSGATSIRLTLNWSAVAPRKRPPGFNPTDPADPAYNWSTPDRLIAGAHTHGLEPLLTISTAPSWAGKRRVSPTKLGQFARAAARRYSGSFQSLPRVRYWLVWNEPNLIRYLAPQYRHHRVISVVRYRKMVNAVAASLHAVHRDNIVVAGETAPLETPLSPGAMKFARAALCVSRHLRSTCKTRLRFDIWSTHPYTSGGPTHRAFGPNGVALGNLPQLRKIVRAAVRLHHVSSARHVQVWATEFSWNTRPPCRPGVPMRLAERWVAEAIYRVWSWHIGMLTWFQLVDYPRHDPYEAGLYFRGKTFAKARRKPILTAFRFPFVAYKHRSHVHVWGRTPDASRQAVTLQRSKGHGWSSFSSLVSNSSGIFFRTLNLPHSRISWSLRAVLAGAKAHSVGFSLRPRPDHFYPTFGC
jgi:hypothetical protein